MGCRAGIFAAIALVLLRCPLVSFAAPGQSLGGRVFNADGSPAAGAFVSIVVNDSDESFHVAASARAGASGEFSLTAPVLVTGGPRTPGAVGLLVADVPGVGFSPPVSIDSGQTSHLDLSFPAELDATFLDPHGNPVAARPASPRTISWSPAPNGFAPRLELPPEIAKRWQVQTGPGGVAAFRGLPRGANVTLDLDDNRFARNFAGAAPQLPANGIIHETIHLEPAASLWISARYEGDRPAPGIHLLVRSASFTGTVVVDDDGRIQLNRLRAGPYLLNLDPNNKPAGTDAATVPVYVRAGVHSEASVILSGLGVITGLVSDQATGKGIPNVSVAAENGEIAVTDAGGNYLLRIPMGYHSVTINAPPDGYLLVPASPVQSQGPVSVNVSAEQPAEVNFALISDPNSPVEGRVLDPKGNPVAGASILYNRTTAVQNGMMVNNVMQTVISDGDGRFSLRAPPGTELRARYRDMATESPVPVGLLGEVVTLKLSANAVFNLKLKIVDPNGDPIPDARASFLITAASATQQQPIPAGDLEFDGLAADTDWRLVASAPDFGSAQLPVPAPTADSPGRVEMTITLPKADQPIGGIVVDQAENPAADIQLMVSGPQVTPSMARTDAQGRFLFHIVKGTQAIVRLMLPQPYQAYVQVSSSRTDLKFYLPADLTPEAARGGSSGASGMQSIRIIGQRIVGGANAPPASQPTAEMLRAKLEARRAAEIQAQQQLQQQGR